MTFSRGLFWNSVTFLFFSLCFQFGEEEKGEKVFGGNSVGLGGRTER